MIIERLKGFWRDDLELEHRQVIIRNAIEQIKDLREALALEQRTAGAEIEKLREALKPFAYYALQIPDDISDTCSASGTVGDLRAAASALRETDAH